MQTQHIFYRKMDVRVYSAAKFFRGIMIAEAILQRDEIKW